jgi:molybdate transport system substrate-binding protein
MDHPRALAAIGKSGPSLLDRMLNPEIRLGTSTPKADPSGDSAWDVFRKAERLEPGALAAQHGKALKLTGAPGMAPPPAGRFMECSSRKARQTSS